MPVIRVHRYAKCVEFLHSFEDPSEAEKIVAALQALEARIDAAREAEVICGRCAKPKQEHTLVNYADGPNIGAAALVCPTSLFHARNLEGPSEGEAERKRRNPIEALGGACGGPNAKAKYKCQNCGAQLHADVPCPFC